MIDEKDISLGTDDRLSTAIHRANRVLEASGYHLAFIAIAMDDKQDENKAIVACTWNPAVLRHVFKNSDSETAKELQEAVIAGASQPIEPLAFLSNQVNHQEERELVVH